MTEPGEITVREERQQNEVADPYSALVAVTRPIIAATLNSVAEEQLAPHGGAHGIKLMHLGRVRKENDGDLGMAFEYAVHQAVIDRDEAVTDRVMTALKMCRIEVQEPESILFAIEKDGAKQLIDTRRDLITAESRVLSGKAGRPVYLKKHMNQLSAAFRRTSTHPALPRSIQGLWKADLFLGSPDLEQWVGTTVKYTRGRLESAAGLRVAVIPTGLTDTDRVIKDEQRNLVMCPIPHDYSFMQTFHEGMRIVQILLANDFRPASRDELPSPIEREVAKVWAERRESTVEKALEVIKTFAQPHLLQTTTEDVASDPFGVSASQANTRVMVGPVPLAT